MTETQKTILSALHQSLSSRPNELAGDKEIAEKLEMGLNHVREDLRELSEQNYIKTLKAGSSFDLGRIVVRELTPKGYLALERKL